MEKMTLFCLPYAGATASVYSRWAKLLPDAIELCPVELAGRGKRFGEPFYENVEAAVEHILEQLEERLQQPFALFGHSMGSLLAYELYFAIRKRRLPEPDIVFFSGRSAPHIPRNNESIHLLPDVPFVEKLSGYGAMPDRFLEDKELAKLFLPILRNDFRIVENYEYVEKRERLACDVAVLYGSRDESMVGDAMEWRRHAGRGCDIVRFDGGHFFIHDVQEQVVSYLAGRLTGIVR